MCVCVFVSPYTCILIQTLHTHVNSYSHIQAAQWAGRGAGAPEHGAAERVLELGDLKAVFDVSAARTDMAHTQLVVALDVPAVDVRCGAAELQRLTAVSLAVWGGDAGGGDRKAEEEAAAAAEAAGSAAAAGEEEERVSTLVGVAGGGVGTLEAAWETMRRRELGRFRGAESEYAQWVRVDATLRVGRVSACLSERAEAALVRVDVRGVEVKGVVRSLDAAVSGVVAAVAVEDMVCVCVCV